MTLLRMRRLDELGVPTGEPVELEVASFSFEPRWPDDLPCAPVSVAGLHHVSMTVQMASPKGLTRLLLGPRLARKQQRAERHRARIVLVPKRRRKHGRIGVYR